MNLFLIPRDISTLPVIRPKDAYVCTSMDCTEAARANETRSKSLNVLTLSNPGYHNGNGAARRPSSLHFNERMCRS